MVEVMAPHLPPFGLLVEQHGDELLAHARKLAGDAAEDLLHDALLRALRAYPDLRHSDHLRAWLYRVTTTTAFDRTRSLKRRKELSVERIPERAHHDHYEDGYFEELLESLPQGARNAIALRFVDDLSYEQIGQKLGCSPDAARQRVAGGVRELRRRLT
jgi:RNA polymerase sigma-70 factor, ECF subfamily